MASVYPIFRMLVPEFEVLCHEIEQPVYVPISTGAPLDVRLIPSPQSLSQILAGEARPRATTLELTPPASDVPSPTPETDQTR